MNEFYWTFRNTKFRGISWIPEHFNRVIIIVHGIGEHMGRYDHVASFFMKQGYAVTGIDHYGHGKTDGSRGGSPGFEYMFDYLHEFLLAVKDQYHQPVVIYGHSMGGGLLTGFLLKRNPQIQAAVISAPALIIGTQPGLVTRTALKLLTAVVPNMRIAQGLNINQISHDLSAVDKFKNDPLRHDRLSFKLANDMIQNGLWCLKHAAELKVKSLLIHGNADSFTAVEGSRIFASLAHTNILSYKEWNNLYHEMHNEPEQEEVFQYIANWLNDVNG